ncbi:oxidoreductase [Umezawaea tangerina]|uniref:Aryl-alcohol dehydrogenase-like predicted oxidoreductase n=1 Tax=Umezawaea tangerina TaxID=84725 RepID=A0A2T0TCK2_9PSEU|nr:oxidoreductase [Umezawaea tangerina]PRY43390.1 aryl-alcohol dehydrogenase-like predicted oxidoreductase [Umezawaea tangerina]
MELNVKRIGYGAMQLAGPGVFGPPADADQARAVLRRAVELGVDHIDTSDYYGPYVVNDLIREALHPYPDDLVLVTKVGARRDDTGAWLPANSPDELRSAVHDNLKRLAVDVIDVVNLRIMSDDDVTAGMTALAELREQGLIKHIGVSNVTAAQLAEAQTVAPVVCVQNQYNLAHRDDDALVDSTAEQDIAFVPFFPLGGFQPLDLEHLEVVARRHGATSRQVALAWLLHRSPNILLIPGTSSVGHLEENLAAGGLQLSEEDLAAF